MVERGTRDLRRGDETIEARLVSISAPRLRALALEVAPPFDEPELRLYRKLEARHGADAQSQHNALVRRIVSYPRAAQCAS